MIISLEGFRRKRQTLKQCIYNRNIDPTKTYLKHLRDIKGLEMRMREYAEFVHDVVLILGL